MLCARAPVVLRECSGVGEYFRVCGTTSIGNFSRTTRVGGGAPPRKMGRSSARLRPRPAWAGVCRGLLARRQPQRRAGGGPRITARACPGVSAAACPQKGRPAGPKAWRQPARAAAPTAAPRSAGGRIGWAPPRPRGPAVFSWVGAAQGGLWLGRKTGCARPPAPGPLGWWRARARGGGRTPTWWRGPVCLLCLLVRPHGLRSVSTHVGLGLRGHRRGAYLRARGAQAGRRAGGTVRRVQPRARPVRRKGAAKRMLASGVC